MFKDFVNQSVPDLDTVFINDKWRWVDVKNPDGITRFPFNGIGGVQLGAECEVLCPYQGRYLCRIKSLPEIAGGTVLPVGALFLYDEDTIRHATHRFYSQAMDRDKERNDIRNLLERL